jgi:hypothetical protein
MKDEPDWKDEGGRLKDEPGKRYVTPRCIERADLTHPSSFILHP